MNLRVQENDSILNWAWDGTRKERGEDGSGPGFIVSEICAKTSTRTVIFGLAPRSKLTVHALKAAVLAPELEIIGSGWFCESSITYMTIPIGVREIQEDAFRNCLVLTRLIIPKGSRLVKIGERAF